MVHEDPSLSLVGQQQEQQDEEQDESKVMMRMISKQQTETSIKTSRAKLFRLYSSRGREEKESNSIPVHGFKISKSKLRDEIEHIVRSKISSIGYPLLAFTRRALQDNDDDDDDESLKIFDIALDLCSSSFSKSVVLSDALKRGGDTNHPMLSRLLTRTEINSSTLLSALRKTDEFEDHLLHDLLFEGHDNINLRVRKNLSSDVLEILNGVLGESLLCEDVTRVYRSVARDADVMKNLAMEYFLKAQQEQREDIRLICAAVGSMSLTFREYITGIQSSKQESAKKNVSQMLSQGLENVKSLLELSLKWKAASQRRRARVSSQKHEDEDEIAKIREAERRFKMAKHQLENASRTQFDESRIALHAQRVKVAESEWKRAKDAASTSRALRLKSADKARKEQDEKDTDTPEMRVVLLSSSGGHVMMDSTLHVAAETGRFRFVKKVIGSTKDNDAVVRLLSMRRPAFECEGHTVVAVAASSSDAQSLRWFLNGCPADFESRTQDLGLELANFGIPLDVARYRMENCETLDDAMNELVYVCFSNRSRETFTHLIKRSQVQRK